MLQIDPWERVAECERYLQTEVDSTRRKILPPQGGGWRRRRVHNVKDPTLPRVFPRWHHTAQRAPQGRELERKVPGDAVASAAFAGVVVFITQIYSEPRRLAPSPRFVAQLNPPPTLPSK